MGLSQISLCWGCHQIRFDILSLITYIPRKGLPPCQLDIIINMTLMLGGNLHLGQTLF